MRQIRPPAELIKNKTLRTQARVNKLDTFKYAFEEMFIDKLIERMDQNQEIFEKILEDPTFGAQVKELIRKVLSLHPEDGPSSLYLKRT